MNGEEGDTSTYVLNGEWALLGMFHMATPSNLLERDEKMTSTKS